MTRQEHLLVTALEECAEIEQRITKALRFGLDEIQPVETGGDGIADNRDKISYEVDDLLAVLKLLGISYGDSLRIEAKQIKTKKFIAYAQNQGTLRD